MPSKALLRASAAAVVFSAGIGASAQGANSKIDRTDEQPTVCTYRDNTPVWHFLPADQIPDDLKDIDKNPVHNERYLTERGGASTRIGALENELHERAAHDFFAALERAIDGDAQSNEQVCITYLKYNGFTDEGAKKQCTAPDESILERTQRAKSKERDPTAEKPFGFNTRDIEQLGQSLTEFDETSGGRPGESQIARIPYGAPLNPGWHYVRVTLAQANLSFSRRFWKTFYPAVHTNIQFDTNAGAQSATGITTDESLFNLDRRRTQRTLVRDQVILPAAPYIGGDFQMDVAVIGVQSYDYATQFMGFLDSVTNDVGAQLLSEVTPIYKILNKGIQYLSRTEKKTQFLQAGVALDFDKPRTGYWLLLWPNDDFLSAYAEISQCSNKTPKTERSPLARLVQNRTGGKDAFAINKGIKLYRNSAGSGTDGLVLLARQTKEGRADKNGQWEPLDNTTWALIRVDALHTNPNWRRITGLTDARTSIMETIISIHLPGLTIGNGSDSTPDNNTGKKPQPSTDKPIEGKPANAGGDAVVPTPSNRQTLKDKLDRDVQFYLSLIVKSPDLLEYDKYKIMQSEILSFERIIHVLRSAELRRDLINGAYRAWRDKEETEAKQKIECLSKRKFKTKAKLTDAELKKCSQSSPAGPVDETDQSKDTPAKPNPVEDKKLKKQKDFKPQPDDEDSSVKSEQSTNLVTPGAAFAKVDQSALALTRSVDLFMAAHPYEATLLNYRGPESINGDLLDKIASHQAADAVRQSINEYLADILMGIWTVSKIANTPLNFSNPSAISIAPEPPQPN